MRINTNGNVGIGTNSPTQLLDLESSTGARIAFTDTGARRWSIGTPEGGSTAFSIYDESGSSEAFRITSSGNVGIGTDAPASLLHTAGSRSYSGTTPNLNSYDVNFVSGSAGIGIGRSGDLPVIQSYGGGTAYNLALNPNAGRVAIGNVSPTNLLHIVDASAANDRAVLKIEAFRPAIRFEDRSDASSSAEICGDNALMFRVSAPVDDDTPLTERMRITNTGYVGIGIESPTTRLDVRDGNFHLMPTGNLPWDSNATNQNEGTYIGYQGRVNLYQLDTNTNVFYSATKVNSSTGVRQSMFSVNTDGLVDAPNGIRFDANTAVLDEYEEGTFTMRVTSSGNFGGSIAAANGKYTKIGRRVYISAKLLANSVNTAGHSGDIRLKGFPFVGGSDALESIATPIAYNGAYGKFAIAYDFPGSLDHILVCNSALSSDRTALFPNGANIRYYLSFSYTIYD